ncbi:hypothetical protein CRG98_023593 [Punica granatum]|uniref:Uncharacterized protein n=1 Tax=Punica granatum TaxID=22663 RepID=A0A2I0JKD0_PUNGR|nr:hypothetical protein CRG98_023593 [Punica granatum]
MIVCTQSAVKRAVRPSTITILEALVTRTVVVPDEAQWLMVAPRLEVRMRLYVGHKHQPRRSHIAIFWKLDRAEDRPMDILLDKLAYDLILGHLKILLGSVAYFLELGVHRPAESSFVTKGLLKSQIFIELRGEEQVLCKLKEYEKIKRSQDLKDDLHSKEESEEHEDGG